MSLSLAEYLQAIPDLEFPSPLHRVGTCPACGQHGMELRLLDIRKAVGIAGDCFIYEPTCPRGCSPARVDAICRLQLDGAPVSELELI